MITPGTRLVIPASSRLVSTNRMTLAKGFALGAIAVVWGLMSSLGWAQSNVVNDADSSRANALRHHFYNAETPLGQIGQQRLIRQDPMMGYPQPVKLMGPEGAEVSIYTGGGFQVVPADDTLVGLTVGHVYRLKITGIPNFPNLTLYPSLEIIGRLFPPPGRETECPVEVHLPTVDLESASRGGLITRVVYLENPETAFPEQQADGPHTIDISSVGDPLREAERFGRPLIILRVGSRIPNHDELASFGFGTPPLQWMQQAAITQPETPPQQPLPTPSTHSPWRDEFLVDGGDRGVQVLVTDDWQVRGLDPEDTIAHFDTLDGRRLVDASNRVAIYAPRFGAVRRLSGVAAAERTQQTSGLRDRQIMLFDGAVANSGTTLQNIQLQGHTQQRTAKGLESKTLGVPVETAVELKQFERSFKGYENFRLLRIGLLDSKEKGRLAIAVDRARAWNQNLSVQTNVDNLHLVVVEDVRSAEETVHVKNEANRPSMRLVKVASTDMALPGDIVEFTIRFDNTGAQTIGNVTVIDKLTTRLEYIEGTAECSVPAEFFVEDNEALSQTLRWEVTDPLEAAKGGVVRFQCRVR